MLLRKELPLDSVQEEAQIQSMGATRCLISSVPMKDEVKEVVLWVQVREGRGKEGKDKVGRQVHEASFQIVGRELGGQIVKQASEDMVNFEDDVELYDSSELVRSKA